MKKSVSNNPVLKFKIKRFKNPSGTLTFDWSKQVPVGLELTDRAIAQVRAVVLPMELKVEKASKKNKNIAAKLLEMWNMGAFKGVIDRKTGKEVTFERAVDGIMGRMTREAEANRDKIWEARRLNFKGLNSTAQTSLQYDEMSDPNNIFGTPKNFKFSLDFLEPLNKSIKLPCTAVDRYGNPTKECAAYVNGILEKNGIRSRGDSYLINNLFKTFINGYDDLEKPSEINPKDITDFHRKAADSLASKLDTLTMDPNKVYTANMYYTDRRGPSGHTVEYFNNATNLGLKQYATHVGLIYKDKNRNQWRVTHNIHGDLKNEPLQEDLGGNSKYGYGITSIANAGLIDPWYSKLIPSWLGKGGNLKKKCKVKKAPHGCIRMPNGLLRCLLSHIRNGVGTQVIIEQHGGIIPETVMPELMVFGNRGGKKTPYKIGKWGPAIFSFLNRKILRNKDFNDYYVDFNNHKLDLVDINSPNIYNSNTQIVGNFFSESENPNTIGTPNSFYKGLLLGDRQIPIEKFSRFVGFENGKMKVGNREIFGKDTLITPVVNKSMQITGPIDDSYDFGSLKNNFILYLGQGENGRKILTHDKVKAFNEYGKKYGYPFDVILLDSGRYDSAISNSKSYMSNDYPRKGRIWGITYQ